MPSPGGAGFYRHCGSDPEEGESDWAREWIGKVRIDGIIDEHFATVDVVEGKIMKNDIVELER